jgi:UDP-N-acetylmuramoyl-tripeptide--D-alanyl-D-alanine ligase
MNCAAAVAAVAAAAPAPLDHEQLRTMGSALTQIEPIAGRLAVKEIDGIIVIDDSYNAQPRSVRIGLEAAREVAQRLGNRLVIALGDMLELGDLAKPAHQEIVDEVLTSNPAVFVAIGDETCSAAFAAQQRGATRKFDLRLCKDSGEAAHLIRDLVRTGDVLFVKGSRGIKTERVVEELMASRKEKP